MLKYCNNMETFRAFVFLLCNNTLNIPGKKRFPQLQRLLEKHTKGTLPSMNRFQVTGGIDFRTTREAFPMTSGNVIVGCKRKKSAPSSHRNF